MIRHFSIFAFLLLALTSTGCAALLVDIGLKPANHGQHFEKQRQIMESRVPGITSWVDSLYAIGVMRDTFIVRDGYRLHSCYAPAPRRSFKTAVIVHGYKANPSNMMMIARMFRDSLGYNVWLPSLRYHGLSEGQAVQMGWKDRHDLLDWSALAHEHLGDTLQVYHGISMGAATVMMASGEETPDYVRGYIEDCGFSTLYGMFATMYERYFHKVDEKVLEEASRICEKRYGWSVYDASCIRQLAQCSKPTLFIHGSGDHLVPCRMVLENYNAKAIGYREFWIAEGSEHAWSYPDYPQEYLYRVRTFLCSHVE